MDSALSTIGLPIALGVIMFGLGLSLTVEDFRRVGKHPKAVLVALGCQLVLLPLLCFGLVKLFSLSPFLAVGMLLLAASPGGTTANLFSHLFRGDVALNVSLTAVNSLISIITLPLVTNFALQHYELNDQVTLPFSEVLQIFAIVLIPVGLGMFTRQRAPGFAHRMDKPVRVASAIILALLIVAILVDQRDKVAEHLSDVGLIAVVFCLLSLLTGYLVPKLFGVSDRQAVASSFEVGVHNATLAIYVAVEILGKVEISVPAAVYGLLMFGIAAIWGLLLTRYLLPKSE